MLCSPTWSQIRSNVNKWNQVLSFISTVVCSKPVGILEKNMSLVTFVFPSSRKLTWQWRSNFITFVIMLRELKAMNSVFRRVGLWFMWGKMLTLFQFFLLAFGTILQCNHYCSLWNSFQQTRFWIKYCESSSLVALGCEHSCPSGSTCVQFFCVCECKKFKQILLHVEKFKRPDHLMVYPSLNLHS